MSYFGLTEFQKVSTMFVDNHSCAACGRCWPFMLPTSRCFICKWNYFAWIIMGCHQHNFNTNSTHTLSHLHPVIVLVVLQLSLIVSWMLEFNWRWGGRMMMLHPLLDMQCGDGISESNAMITRVRRNRMRQIWGSINLSLIFLVIFSLFSVGTSIMNDMDKTSSLLQHPWLFIVIWFSSWRWHCRWFSANIDGNNDSQIRNTDEPHGMAMVTAMLVIEQMDEWANERPIEWNHLTQSATAAIDNNNNVQHTTPTTSMCTIYSNSSDIAIYIRGNI